MMNYVPFLALPARLGGIALDNPTSRADLEFSASIKVTNPLKKAILQQNVEYSGDVVDEQVKAIADICKQKSDLRKQAANYLKQSLPAPLKRSMDLAQEKGASTWLTSLPIEEFEFALHKNAFQDALALRYN